MSEQFLRLLDPDPILADAKYRELFKRLVKFFEWRKCSPADDLAQETLKRGLARVASGVDVYTADPSHYFIGIARFVAMETWNGTRFDSDDKLDDQPSGFNTAEQVEAGILLEQCLARLDAAERTLLVRYHTGDREALRRELGVEPGALRVRVHRIVQKVNRATRKPLVTTK